MSLFCTFCVPANWGLERNSFCHFCNCCCGWWSWKEMDLLHFQSFLPYMCCDWKLGSWKELVLVLSCSFWPVMDWGLERRSWNDLFLLFYSSPWLRTAPVHWSCLPIYVFDLRQIISLDGFNARHSFGIIFAQYLYETESDTCWVSYDDLFLSQCFYNKEFDGLKRNSVSSVWASVWAFHDSLACRCCSTGVLSVIPWGIHLWGSHPHLICGRTLTWKYARNKMFALAPSLTLTSMMSTTFLYGSLTLSQLHYDLGLTIWIYVIQNACNHLWPGNTVKCSKYINIINIILVNFYAVSVASLWSTPWMWSWPGASASVGSVMSLCAPTMSWCSTSSGGLGLGRCSKLICSKN